MQQRGAEKIFNGDFVKLGFLRPIVAQQTARYDVSKKYEPFKRLLTLKALNFFNL